MFIRRKVKTAKGQRYEQHQLLKSVRTPNGPRQKVILNMGQLDLPKKYWKALADAIEEHLNNQSAFGFAPSYPQEVSKLAAHYAQMVVSQSFNRQKADEQEDKAFNDDQDTAPKTPGADYQKVDIHSVKTTQSRSIGAEYVIAEQMKRFDIDKILAQLDFSEKQIDYAKYLIIGRAVHPSSERELTRWIKDDSAVQELIDSTATVYDNALHRTALQLWEHRDELQKKLRQKAKDLFSLDEKIILYDLTNTYFEGQKSGSAKAQFGRSKEKRSDCKLMTMALVVDSLGFPKESHILEGNVCEAGTLAKMIESIKELGHSVESKTLVIDAGIATEANIALLRKEKISYVAISRKRSHDPSLWEQCEATKIPLKDQKSELSVKLTIIESPGESSNDSDNQGDGENHNHNNGENQSVFREALLLCHSPQKEVKERQMIERRLNKFEAALSELNASLSRTRTTKKANKINERIGRIKEKYPVGNCFDIELNQKDGKVLKITWEKNAKSVERLQKTGEYVIRTDRVDLNEGDISCIHRSLTTIENSFRAMKSDLGLRPNYHHCEEATTAHMFLSVLAYHMVCPVLKRLSQSGLNYTWHSVRNILASHDRVVTSFNTEDQHCIYVKNTTKANLNQKSIYDGLGIKHDPLGNMSLKRKIEITQQKL